ncbi:GNAT family N-acetyltransferase [Vibrio nitrifigilis]|uniref:N-acetyltransferase n=1 Tax=Vibrio nitrifigilis TaxID=2789781 RepID=A0ABS0G9Y5_9VIBR|nr:N-acetyltransferase [Vibrio nitrifigilis]MBF8999227.1 N-acetyltransferase [Vibrio nitrifigilis]
MLIRTEAPADILSIDRLLKETFETEAEAQLVMSLRENGHFTLSLVACTDEGDVIGHAVFSPLHIDGEESSWQGIAPICVKPEFRHQGIGSQLIREGLDSLSELGYPGCITSENSEFWSQLGFKTDPSLSVAGNETLVCQILTLWEDHTPNPTGAIKFGVEFDHYLSAQ